MKGGIDNMNIELSDNYKCVSLKQINAGDCFMYSNRFYLKTDEEMYESCRCVNLETGFLTDLLSNTCVDVVDVKLCVKRIFDDTDK